MVVSSSTFTNRHRCYFERLPSFYSPIILKVKHAHSVSMGQIFPLAIISQTYRCQPLPVGVEDQKHVEYACILLHIGPTPKFINIIWTLYIHENPRRRQYHWHIPRYRSNTIRHLLPSHLIDPVHKKKPRSRF